MPRRSRRDQQQGGPIQKRVRSGCKTCRLRKVKCDEGKPCCRNCALRGLTCDNGVQLKWEQEFASRGLAFGRQGRWSKGPKGSKGSRDDRDGQASPGGADTPSVEQQQMLQTEWCTLPLVRAHHFINSLSWEFDPTVIPRPDGPDEDLKASRTWRRLDVLQLDDPSMQAVVPYTCTGGGPLGGLSPLSSPGLAACSLPFSTLTLSYALPQLPAQSSIDPGLLNYYLVRICPLTTPSRFCPSPFASLIVPVLHLPGHDDILNAVMALSARHLSTSDHKWEKTGMALRDGVISALRRRLLLASEPGGKWDAQILVLMMFLCLYEIVDNCDHRWVIHLRASQDVIRRSRQLLPAVESGGYEQHLGGLTTFTERFFAFQDVISRTACENSPIFGNEYWSEIDISSKYDAQLAGQQVSDIDAWMGCSPALVQILSRISELSRLKAKGDISASEMEKESAELEEALDALAPDSSLDAVTGPTDNALALSAELKRKSILLYHHCVLYNTSPMTPAVSQMVAEILEGASELASQGMTAGLSFPLFVAAVELDPLDNQTFRNRKTGEMVSGRRLVLETLQVMATCSLSNVYRTEEVIQKVWRMRDMSLADDEVNRLPKQMPGASMGPANDWSVFVGPYSLNISLA